MRRSVRKIFVWSLIIIFCVIVGSLPALCKMTDEEKNIRQKIMQHVQEHSIYPEDCTRLEFLSKIPVIKGGEGKKITYGIESRSRESYIGDTSFNVRMYADGVFVGEESVRVRIEVLKEFVVSLRSITRNTILDAQDVVVQKKWVKNFSMNTVSSLDDVIGKNMIISIRPNTQITSNMLREITPVKKGKMVQVILDNGVMRMLLSGLAEEDGEEDALVKVRNLSSNKIIYARVIGPSKVQVDF